MFKSMVEKLVREDINDEKLSVKTLVVQETYWDEFTECRAICTNGEAYACLYQGGDKLTPFVLIPKEIK